MHDLSARLSGNRLSSRTSSVGRLAVLAMLATNLAASLAAQGFDWNRQPLATSPAARSDHAMAYHDATGRVVLFGGTHGSLRNDTWVWKAGTWADAAPATVPTARRDHAMASDDVSQTVVLFGGMSAGGQLGDTWLWNGADWQQVLPGNSPSARSGHAMAFDQARQRVILFGGTSAGQQLADTWEWDGSNWMQITSASNPVARVGHAMSYDVVRQRTVLFGGSSVGVGALADTWEWNGTLWQPSISVNFPAARSGHAMTFDGSLASTILFGGAAGQNADDTWQWDGVNWTQITPAIGAPAPRAESSLVFADADNQLILFGGDNGSVLPDTWTAGAASSTYGTGCGSPALQFQPNSPGPFVGVSLLGTISNAPTNLAAVAIGIDREFFGPFPLPLPLTSLGMTGCELWHSAEIAGLAATPLVPGTLLLNVALPNAQGLVGRHIYGQAFAFAPGQNPAEIIVSNGVDWLIRCPSLPQQMIVEDFNSNSMLEAGASAGSWVGGFGSFASIGGDARHGDFDIGLAVNTGIVIAGRAVYEMDCGNTIIPGTQTTTGESMTVSDGRFFFGSMHLPAATHLRFVGSQPPVITVAGDVSIFGVLDVSAPDVGFHQSTTATGQSGGEPGVFGGAGGKGGDRCVGVGPGSGQFDGVDGTAVSVLSGHAYASSTPPTAGRGSDLYPASGLSQDQQFGASPPFGLMYCLSAAAGGSGGGLFQPGQPGAVIQVLSGAVPLPNQATFMGPPSTPGAAMQVLPYPGGPQLSSQHFLLGGAGGGGAASNCTMSLSLARSWASGAGGGGGGGALALRAGNTATVHSGGILLAMGGDGYDYVGVSAGAQVAPAGGGSGGSVLIQASNGTFSQGLIDMRGGRGGFFQRQGGSGIGPNGGIVEIKGGDGGAGYVRYETLGFIPIPAQLGTVLPTASQLNTGLLTDVDDTSSMRSLFYSTNLACSPKFVRYELDAVVNGATVTFSDDPTVSPMMASFGAPVRVLLQAGYTDLISGVTTPIGPWRISARSVPGQSGIDVDGGNSYRFMVIIDRNIATATQVDRLAVVYEN